MGDADKNARHTWLVLKKLEEDCLLASDTQYVRHEVGRSENTDYPAPSEHVKILGNLVIKGAIKVRSNGRREDATRVIPLHDFSLDGRQVRGIFFEKISPKFENLYQEYSQLDNPSGRYTVAIHDREIKINDFLLSKPFVTHRNLEFFEYIYKNAGSLIRRQDLPDYLQERITGREFTDILYDLGFRGSVLKVFFPKRAKSGLLFRKEITNKELDENKVKLGDFLRDIAAVKKNPK